MGEMKKIHQELQELGFGKPAPNGHYLKEYPWGNGICIVGVSPDGRVYREHGGGRGVMFPPGTSISAAIPKGAPTIDRDTATELLEEIEDRMDGVDDEWLNRIKGQVEKAAFGVQD